VDAAADGIAKGMAVVGCGGQAAGAEARDASGDAAGGGQQEMPGAAGGIDDRDGEQGGGGILGFALDAIEDWIEGAVEQCLHKAVGGVVAAGLLALVALGLDTFSKSEAAAIECEAGSEFEQSFVDGAEFFGLHVAPVDGDDDAVVAEPGEAEDGFHEGAVGKTGSVEAGGAVLLEKAAEGGQSKARLAVGQRTEDDEQAFPAVVELIPAAAANGAIAQGAERVAFGVELAGLVRGIGRMEETAVFRRKQEDEAIDKAKQLIEELRHRQPATGEPVAEICVRRIREESVAESEQCFFDANAEALARCEALFASGFAPAFESTVGDRAAWLTEAAGMDDEPERGKAGEVLVFEDLPQVGF
jgi:hypothetical protein